jgi:hypothetical protein
VGPSWSPPCEWPCPWDIERKDQAARGGRAAARCPCAHWRVSRKLSSFLLPRLCKPESYVRRKGSRGSKAPMRREQASPYIRIFGWASSQNNPSCHGQCHHRSPACLCVREDTLGCDFSSSPTWRLEFDARNDDHVVTGDAREAAEALRRPDARPTTNLLRKIADMKECGKITTSHHL